jgi:GMP synthase (glutamine-hydrolysing)
MPRAVILKHVDFEGPARIGELLVELGYALDVRAVYAGDAVPSELDRRDLLVVMGGPMGVLDLGRAEYPFLQAEVALLRQRIAERAPVLGVCLGAQLLAHAAGAAVFPMTSDGGQRLYEVGWGPIRFQRGSSESLLRDLPDEAVVLHWHGDTFELPAGAQRLASSARCLNQAFRLGTCQFGLQFHCEVGAEEVAAFIRADAGFVEKANGAGSLQLLREETARRVSALRSVGDLLLQNILAAMISG